MEEMSGLVERLGVDHIDDEDKPKYKANQHGGDGDCQHDPLLLLLSSNNNFLSLRGDLLTWESILALVNSLSGATEKKGGASSLSLPD